jgi:Domain of unknown function (DUF3883)
MPNPELPVWAIAPGVPSPHLARAALHAASTIDRGGSPIGDVRDSYWHRATGGYFPEPDLQRGERLLVDCGLVVEREGRLVPTSELDALLDGTVEDGLELLAARAITATSIDPLTRFGPESDAADALEALIPDLARREALLLALGRRFNDEHRRMLGEIGEEIVTAEARYELEQLGYPDLARAVRRVSLESDQLGYDVSAPRVSGVRRLLEVKATTMETGTMVSVHLSRNEVDVGERYASEWALVICHITDVEARVGQIVGWCTRYELAVLLPTDVAGGSWEQARLDIPTSLLTARMPRAVD